MINARDIAKKFELYAGFHEQREDKQAIILTGTPGNFGHFEYIICYLKYQQSSSVFSYKLIV
jgi:hypothetical protein